MLMLGFQCKRHLCWGSFEEPLNAQAGGLDKYPYTLVCLILAYVLVSRDKLHSHSRHLVGEEAAAGGGGVAQSQPAARWGLSRRPSESKPPGQHAAPALSEPPPTA